MEWSFGIVLWWTLVAFIWFAAIWIFIAVFADIVRRDMSGWAKAAWIILVVFLPLLGSLGYLVAKPRGRRPNPHAVPDPLVSPYPVTAHPVEEITGAARLHDDGTPPRPRQWHDNPGR